MLRSVASWAKVGRELINGLRTLGVHVCVDEHRDDRFDPTFPLPSGFSHAADCRAPDAEHVAVTFASPTDYPRLPLAGRAGIGLLAWEATEWPTDWVGCARDHVSRIAVPATFPAATLAASGYPADRIGVVPHGVDHSRYRPGTRRRPGTGDKLTLLFVGTSARRKGLDILVDALLGGVPARSVELVVKLAPYADAARRPYLDPDWRAHLARLERRGFAVRIIDEVVSEQRMAELYRGADLLCHPFRGECFPLPFLEAMACGTPVLCTAWSGPLDLLDREVALLAPPTGRPRAAPFLPDPAMAPPGSTMVEPDPRAVTALLRSAVQRPVMLGEMGERARSRTLAWTWSAAAARLVEQAHLAIAFKRGISAP
jgi:glycosyltransferase involved in cell wall biosynthesis